MRRNQTHFSSIILLISLGLSACGEFLPLDRGNDTLGSLNDQQKLSESLTSMRVRFHHSDFHTITDANVYGCAGDTKTYYSSLSGTTGNLQRFPASIANPSNTIRPAFVKNVSVDITDSNAAVEINDSFGCSYGIGSGALPSSNCATFDYGAIGGIPTSLGGSLLVLGGVRRLNYANQASSTLGQSATLACGPLIPFSDTSGEDAEFDVNECRSDLWAIAVDTLDRDQAGTNLTPGLTTANEPISSISNLSTAAGYSGPTGGTGGSMSYQREEQEVILFGGISPLSGTTPLDPHYDSRDTWIYDVPTQTWNKIATQSKSDIDLTSMADCETTVAGSCTSVSIELTRGVGGRSLFGYVAAPGFAANGMTTADTTGDMTAALEDTTDRILVSGGILGTDTSGDFIYLSDVQKFNPTYGPEFVNFEASNSAADQVTQYTNAFHTQILHVSNEDHLLYDNAHAAGETDEIYNFGAEMAYNFTGVGGTNAGYMVIAGGFNTYESSSTNHVAVNSTTSAGNLQYTARAGNEQDGNHYAASPTFDFYDFFTGALPEGLELASITWTDIGEGTDGGDDSDNIPDNLGGMSLVRGLDPTSNTLVLFGGTNCIDYITDNGSVSQCPGSSETIDTLEGDGGGSRYWNLGATIPANFDAATSHVITAGTPPNASGMASSRGLDGSANPIVVAFGGTTNGTGAATDSRIFYLYDDAGTATWTSVIPSGTAPQPVINGALVFSHVTRKFYLFGGYETQPTTRFSADTWELAVSGDCTTGACTFEWEKLNVSGGSTCYPNCTDPPARRGHRMVEVNYNNTDPTSEYADCTDEGIGVGNDDACSFGIFMEGGTDDGIATLGDRWMFDPTANGGRGHWQRMDDLPPRRLAASASINFFVPELNRRVSRTLIFGGETGLHSPGHTNTTDQVFLAPTLGDTHLFDHETQQWHRAALLGLGIHDQGDDYDYTADTRPQRQVRQTYLANDADANRALLAETSPPPMAGADMAVRTFPAATLSTTAAVEPLKIPEIWLTGGRTKGGSYIPLNQIYKFCMSSTGEDWINNNGQCDAYDEDNNSSSPSPSKRYEGRWLRKSPPDASTLTDGIDPSSVFSYMGANTYDPINDRVVLMGGLSPAASTDLVIAATTRSITGVVGGKFNTYEYTPPTASIIPGTTGTANDPLAAVSDYVAIHGQWSMMEPCDSGTQPTGRYGHSMAFDELNGQILLYGGYDVDDTALTQEWLVDGVSNGSVVADLWAGVRTRTADYSNSDASTTYCYDWRQIQTFGNRFNDTMAISGIAHSASTFIPSSGYNSGFYSMFDDSCIGSGPIASTDPLISRTLAGGAYIDLDRSQLGPNENLLLSVTYLPLGDQNRQPDSEFFSNEEEAILKVHLISTGKSGDFLRQVTQPRYLTFINQDSYPTVVDTLSVLSVPTGRLRQDQIVLPISIDPSIDRVRIERLSGSSILIDASVHRMGYR